MPIRSPHGRAAAYRALWQWPLRSPKRLVGSLLVVLALAAGLSYGFTSINGGGRSGGVVGGVAARPSDTARPAPSATALPPVPALAPVTLPLSKAPPAALDVARRWSRAWVRPAPGTSTQQWLDGLRGTTTDEYLGVLAGVDPANVPAGRVTGNPKAVRVSPSSVQVQIATDGPTLLVLVVDTDAGWRVAGYDRS
jgi:hypothetical protein